MVVVVIIITIIIIIIIKFKVDFQSPVPSSHSSNIPSSVWLVILDFLQLVFVILDSAF
jgi:hypothetical protein